MDKLPILALSLSLLAKAALCLGASSFVSDKDYFDLLKKNWQALKDGGINQWVTYK